MKRFITGKFRRRGSSRGVAMVIVMGMLLMLTGMAAGTLSITGVGLAGASAERKFIARADCRDRVSQYLIDNLGDWKIVLARKGGAYKCRTMYTVNMSSYLPAGDVVAPSGPEDPATCYEEGADMCPPSSACGQDPDWQAFRQREAQALARFQGEPTMTFDDGDPLKPCGQTRAVMALYDPVLPIKTSKVGKQQGRQGDECTYGIRLFVMNLPQNDQRYYSNYLDIEYIRTIYSSTGCIY
ncbi:MAG: hypothetical protein KIT79_06285 [Deltaproteobacteria bacterium]|nr:hypothetical protein [Deltaproteobacteria bacterium]